MYLNLSKSTSFMIKLPPLKKIKENMDQFEADRDKLIGISREIVRLSKQIIYSYHRDDFKHASLLQKDADKLFQAMAALIKENPSLNTQGSARIAVQEFVEAKAFGEVLTNDQIPPFEEGYLDEENYLMGLCDLVGELNRRAVNAAIKGDKKTPLQIRDVVDQLYGFFIQLDLGNGELRKKVDGIKYELKKLENLVLEQKHNA